MAAAEDGEDADTAGGERYENVGLLLTTWRFGLGRDSKIDDINANGNEWMTITQIKYAQLFPTLPVVNE